MKRFASLAVGAVLAVLAVLLMATGAPAQASARPKITQLDSISRFKLETRVATAASVEPGDHLSVKVGDVDHAAPAAPSWACPTGVWVLALDRQTLDQKSSADYPLCNAADAAHLGDVLKQLPSAEAVIVNSVNHHPGGHPLTLDGIGDALANIGVPRAELAAVDLARTGFSVYGIPQLSEGQAYVAQDRLADEASVPSGAPTPASINGSLVPDDHANFTLTMPDYAIYDISATGDITLNDHPYPVPKPRPAGFKGGFHVLVVNRRTLQPISDNLYSTNDDLPGQLRMESDLTRLAATHGEGALIFLATVGDPIGTQQLPAGPARESCPGGAVYSAEAFATACTYRFTGSPQTFVVPQEAMSGVPVTSLQVELRGANGGPSDSGGSGGDGDQVDADLAVGPDKAIKPGQTLSVLVGGAGDVGGRINGAAGGFNGGAGGGSSCGICSGWPGGGGGGASDIRTLSPSDSGSLASRLVVAAGGGGGGGDSQSAHGGDGGDAVQPGGAGGGGAGTASGGGGGGSSPDRSSLGGKGGSLAFGGGGASNGDTFTLSPAGSGGGGGGGYYGGGGGATGNRDGNLGGGGGGGGSDLVPTGGTAQPIVDQEKDHIPASVVIRYLAPYGPTLGQLLRRFGATPTLIDGLKDSPRYALVGALDAPADLGAGSFNAPEASPDIKDGATGQLQGVLQRGNRNMWFGPAAQNLPAIRDSNGHTKPPSVVNYGLYNVISHVSAPWPVPAGTPGDPVYTAQADALHFLSNAVCQQPDIRVDYDSDENTIGDWHTKMQAVAFEAGHGFDQSTFDLVKGQLVTELADVHVVDGLEDAMHTAISDDQQMLGPTLTSAYKDVRDTIQLDGNARVLSIIHFVAELFTELAPEAPGVGPALGVLSAVLGFSNEFVNEPGGENKGALETTVDELANQAVSGFTGQLNGLGQTFAYLYSNWGKLSAVANGLTGKDSAGWNISTTNAGQYVAAMTNAIKTSYYQSLVTSKNLYESYEAQAAPTSDLKTVTNQYNVPIFKDFQYPWSAYTYPVHAAYLHFADAHDLTVVGQPPVNAGFTKSPFPQDLAEHIKAAGLYLPYLFLRWNFASHVCAGSIDQSCVFRGSGG